MARCGSVGAFGAQPVPFWNESSSVQSKAVLGQLTLAGHVIADALYEAQTIIEEHIIGSLCAP